MYNTITRATLVSSCQISIWSILTVFDSDTQYRYSFIANNCDYATRLCITHSSWNVSGHVRLMSPFEPDQPS